MNVGGSNPSPPPINYHHAQRGRKLSSTDISLIRDLEERRYTAMREGDIKVLEVLLHDELHAFYRRSRIKKGYLDGLRSGTSAYKKIEFGDQKIRVHGDLAMVFHHLIADAVFEGNDRHLDNRLLAIWIREDGQWRMIGLQSGPVLK